MFYTFNEVGAIISMVFPFVLLLVHILKIYGISEYKKIAVSLSLVFILTIGTILYIPNTNLYKILKLHIAFLHIDSVTDVVSIDGLN